MSSGLKVLGQSNFLAKALHHQPWKSWFFKWNLKMRSVSSSHWSTWDSWVKSAQPVGPLQKEIIRKGLELSSLQLLSDQNHAQNWSNYTSVTMYVGLLWNFHLSINKLECTLQSLLSILLPLPANTVILSHYMSRQWRLTLHT